MTTTHQKQRSRSRFAAAAMLAGILAASAIGPAAPAHAAGTFLALAYQQSYGFGGKLIYRDAYGVGQSGVMDTARINAINDCQKNRGETGGGNARCASLHAMSAPPSPRQTGQGDGRSPPRPPTTSN